MDRDSLFAAGDGRQWLSTPELAALSGRSRRVIVKACQAGKIPGADRDSGKRARWYIPRDGAEAWWANLERPKKLTINPTNGCQKRKKTTLTK